MSNLRNISFGSLPRQAETCPEQDGPKGPASDAPSNETKVATPDYDKITPDVLSHLAKRSQENATSIGGDQSTTNASPTAGIEKSGPQAASDSLQPGKALPRRRGQAGHGSTRHCDYFASCSRRWAHQTEFRGWTSQPLTARPNLRRQHGRYIRCKFWKLAIERGEWLPGRCLRYQAYQQSQRAQGGPPQSGPPAVDLLPSGGGDRPPSSQGQLGDFPDSSSPESTAGNQDDPSSVGDPGTPDDPNGPTGLAYNPEGDYGRGGGLPGVMGPGVASFDPEAGGVGSGGSGVNSVNVPGF